MTHALLPSAGFSWAWPTALRRRRQEQDRAGRRGLSGEFGHWWPARKGPSQIKEKIQEPERTLSPRRGGPAGGGPASMRTERNGTPTDRGNALLELPDLMGGAR